MDSLPRQIVLASGNQGKLSELQQMLAPLRIELLSQSALDVPQAHETGQTFVENAILKARNAAAHTGLPALADDSGLCLPALGGAPGVHSARYAGEHADDQANNRKLLDALAGLDEQARAAHFECAIVYMRHAQDPTPLICQASWSGVILHSPRGEQGFGYDPLFFVPAAGKSAAEMSAGEKNRCSHRGQAVASLLQALQLL